MEKEMKRRNKKGMNCRNRPGNHAFGAGSSVCLFLFFLFLSDLFMGKSEVKCTGCDNEIKDFGDKSNV